MSLTPKQVQLIHVARAKTRMSEEAYDGLLSRFGVTTSKDPKLQASDYREIMREFAALGFVPRPKPATAGGGSRGQVQEIERLCRAHQVDGKRLAGIVSHVCKMSAAPSNPLKWCDRKQLSKIIQALRNWNWEK